MAYHEQYAQIYDYLSAPHLPTGGPESTVVFGRNDALVSHALGDLIIANNVGMVVISGGVGRDTSNLLERGYRSEADFLVQDLHEDAKRRDYAAKLGAISLVTEEAAKNGADNARNSLAILWQHNQPTNIMTATAHGTSALRLAEGLAFEAHNLTGQVPTVYRKPTAYEFDPTNPKDQEESRAELLRLADWPTKNWLGPHRQDLPWDLVDFAKDTK